MAELIPLEYRIAVSQRHLIRRWAFIMALVVAVAGGGFFSMWRWQQKQFAVYQAASISYNKRAIVKLDARQVIDRRDEMAGKMAMLQEVQDDQLMLSLLQNVTKEFSDQEIMEDITLEIHGKQGDERAQPGSFSVTLNGITQTDITLAALLDRFSKAGGRAPLRPCWSSPAVPATQNFWTATPFASMSTSSWRPQKPPWPPLREQNNGCVEKTSSCRQL